MEDDQGAPPDPEADQDSGNLDEHIAELESLVAKGEKPSVLSMRKAVSRLSEIRKSQKITSQKKKSNVVSAQKKFVNNIIKSWDKETKDVTEGIEDIIKQSGLKIKE